MERKFACKSVVVMLYELAFVIEKAEGCCENIESLSFSLGGRPLPF